MSAQAIVAAGMGWPTACQARFARRQLIMYGILQHQLTCQNTVVI